MLREVAYGSLPFEERRQKHLGIAKWIERTKEMVLGGKPADQPGDQQQASEQLAISLTN